MRRLTDEELKEPDVTLIIPSKVWRGLSKEVKDTLRFWIDRGNGDQHIFVIPAYRARELETIQGVYQDKSKPVLLP